jgi:hypothetical protein
VNTDREKEYNIVPPLADGNYRKQAIWSRLQRGGELMTQYYALLSIVFMMNFVLLFDRAHFKAGNTRFCNKGLLDEREIERLRTIWSACQES